MKINPLKMDFFGKLQTHRAKQLITLNYFLKYTDYSQNPQIPSQREKLSILPHYVNELPINA